MAEFHTRSSVIEIVPVSLDGEYDRYLTEEDADYCKKFSNPKRRASWKTWRGLVRKHIGQVPIYYDRNGAPVVDGGGIYLGVSHSADYVAVILSHAKCAIDIESMRRNFDKAAPRYITPSESILPESHSPIFKGALWCAKETMYKYATHRKIDFLKDMEIVSTDFANKRLQGKLRNHTTGTAAIHDIAVYTFDESILTYIG